jgi:hypothetical protein
MRDVRLTSQLIRRCKGPPARWEQRRSTITIQARNKLTPPSAWRGC